MMGLHYRARSPRAASRAYGDLHANAWTGGLALKPEPLTVLRLELTDEPTYNEDTMIVVGDADGVRLASVIAALQEAEQEVAAELLGAVWFEQEDVDALVVVGVVDGFSAEAIDVARPDQEELR
ncbi:hypothetical protein LTR37_016217 [Vermiconidia calcicola]|uniref:Uncharacterized protein n=1 Tax=Vermiconidia calcicola TaxID=1690605 RepID=A0ACC3MNH9_9PEZI|nr:hypothetical protein LTR37_016217 [Vermiconidia calcicola]